jgi:hypothetical protein
MSDPRDIWQNLNTKGRTMSANEVRAKAQRLESEIRRDTVIGFVLASVITLAGLVGLTNLQQLEPGGRIIIGIAVILVWFGAWRSTVRNKGRLSEADSRSCLEFYRHEVQRRRDHFAKPPWILIFALVLALFQFFVVARRFNGISGDLLRYPFALVVLTLIVVPIWKRQARKFQSELDALSKFENE